MAKAHEKILKAYRFFCHAEKSGLQFTLEEVSIATGWTIQTTHSYRSKKWYWFLEENQGKFCAKGICNYPEKSFIRIHTQHIDTDTRNLRPRFSERIDALIDKARESALLAVQTYNNPLTVFRTPAYLMLMNVAFMALFHAIFERDEVEYFYKNPDGTPERLIDGEPASWELLKCASYYYQDKREAISRIQSKEYELIRRYIDSYQSDLPPEIVQSQKYAFRVFLMPRLGNHATSSNVAIEFIRYDPNKPEEMREYEKQIAMLKEKIVPVQVANQGKLRPLAVISKVKEATGKPFSVNLHTAAWKLYNIRPQKPGPQNCQTEFCHYDEAHQDIVYTEKWVQFLIEKVNDPNEFEKIQKFKPTLETHRKKIKYSKIEREAAIAFEISGNKN